MQQLSSILLGCDPTNGRSFRRLWTRKPHIDVQLCRDHLLRSSRHRFLRPWARPIRVRTRATCWFESVCCSIPKCVSPCTSTAVFCETVSERINLTVILSKVPLSGSMLHYMTTCLLLFRMYPCFEARSRFFATTGNRSSQDVRDLIDLLTHKSFIKIF